MKKDTDWFEELYNNAQGDSCSIPWAKLAPDPILVEFLSKYEKDTSFEQSAL